MAETQITLEFNKRGFVETLVHLAIAAAAASLSGASYPEIHSDMPHSNVQTLV